MVLESKDKPLISVIIPCFNAGKWVCQAAESVVSQDFKSLEVIMIDDGSTDGSADIIRRNFPQVRVVTTVRQGPSSARNYGTQLAKGEFIQYLDADDALADGKLTHQCDCLRSSGADVAYGKWQALFRDWRGVYVKKDIIGKPFKDPEIDLFTDAWFPPAAYLFRRSLVEKIGGWRNDLPIIQDARFALDCALYGGRFAYCDRVVAYYRKHNSGSVSTKNPQAFIRDCFCNAQSVETWWCAHGGVTEKRRRALIQVYEYVARQSIGFDLAMHKKALQAIWQLDPGYTPSRCFRFRMCQKFLGYEKAERIGYWYRFFRDMVRGVRK